MAGSGAARGRAQVAAPALVGRDGELKLLAAAVVAAPAVVLVQGEAGIGKTRLVAELAARPELTGRRWLSGGCHRLREPFPLGAVLEAVRGLGGRLANLGLSPAAGALRPLLPELAEWLPPAPAALDDRAGERHRVFRALSELLGAAGPAVLVVEDVHWADEQTPEFLSYLFAQPPPELAVVVTFRGEEVDPALRAAAARVPAGVGRAEVTLGPLDAEQTGQMTGAILGIEQVSATFAAHLCARASGVPLAIEELLALLQARGSLAYQHGSWRRMAIDELDVPAGIRDPVLERVARASVEAQSVVQAAAVLQEPAPLSMLSQVCGLDAQPTQSGVEEAVASGLLVEHGDAIGFRHVLASQAVYEALPGTRRTQLHARAAAALPEQHPVPLGRLAYHLRRAGRLHEWAEVAERAADQATGVGHDDEAARLLAEVLREAPLEADPRGRIAVKLGRAAYETVSSTQHVIELLTPVLDQPLSPVVRGELALWMATAIERAAGDPARRRELYARAVADLDDRPDLKAWAMMGLAIPTTSDVPLAEHRVWLGRVLRTLPEIDSPRDAVFLAGKAGMVLVATGDREWRRLAERVLEQTGGAPRHVREINAYMAIGNEACYAGHYQAAGELLRPALEAAVACESRQAELAVRVSLALLDYFRGAWSSLDHAVAMLLEDLADYPLVRADVDAVAGCLALARGDVDRARQQLSAVAQRLEAVGENNCLAFAAAALARLGAVTGDVEDAGEHLAHLLAGVEAKGLWAPVARGLPAAAQLLTATGRTDQADDLVTRAAHELAQLDAPLAPAALTHARGFLDIAAEDSTQASINFMTAAKLYEQLDCPYEAAQAREQAGAALLTTGDRTADRMLRAALDSYQQLGASWDVARCLRIARSHRIHLRPAHHGGRKGYGDALSPRQEEIAVLAAAGLSNSDIAAKLFLSPTTVDKHLQAAYRKLGVHSRAGLAHQLNDRDTSRGKGGVFTP